MECAVFLEKPDDPTITVEILERDGFETSPPLFECYVAEEKSENKSEVLERDGIETSPPLFECYVAEEKSENKSEVLERDGIETSPPLFECYVAEEKSENKSEVLERDGIETSPPLFECYVAEEKSENKSEDTVLVGYAVYCYGYSTWNGRKLVLQDVFCNRQIERKRCRHKVV
ncbi:uncharacterized protein LOC124359636 isoform X2 [Homalodisca vitripennis]|uniref:uncharacterized protein LOC124359636 isoform X2 n=1 Tax=Homalodisca vitripennis TaxID=197043 RepID=UPI001EECD77D|nr:uncharacterized protein LOC124359636 isoform X2 [Homalodisca vitripennis]